MDKLQYDHDFWRGKLGDLSNASLDNKLHLILSLVIFLAVSIRELLVFIFTTELKPVKDHAARFLGYSPTRDDLNLRFPAAHIFSVWLEQCHIPDQRAQMRFTITPLAKVMVLEDSDRVIKDVSLQIRVNNLTISGIRELLDPSKLAAKYRALAPFFFEPLEVFTASPNKYRKYEKELSRDKSRSPPFFCPPKLRALRRSSSCRSPCQPRICCQIHGEFD
jgi:hypothetical protein